MRRVVVIAASILCSAGCATVPAWERETLAHEEMQERPDPEAAAMRSHVAGARESALEPGRGGGGGCGCN